MWIWKPLLNCARIRRSASFPQARADSCRPAVVVIERLEPRIVFTTVVVPAVPASAYEEYFLELINRARANPVAEAARLGIDLNEGLPAGTLPAGSRQPLALKADLQSAIEGHLSDEIAKNYFSHTGSDGSTPESRITASGYTGWTAIGENLGWEGTTGTVNLTQFVTDNYDNLFIDSDEPGRGHRVNIVDGDFAEVGSAVQSGAYQGYNSVLVGNDFGVRKGNSFVTGVIFTDAAATSFYQVGEGLAGDTVTVTDSAGDSYQTTSNAGGGYQIQLPAGNYTVTFSGPGISSPIAKALTITNQNVEVDANLRTDIAPGGPPVLSGTNPATYSSTSGAVSIDSAISITDLDRTTLALGTVTITNFVSGEDILGFVPNAATMGNIAVTSNGGGVLTLSSSGATATLTQWQAALHAVTFLDSSSHPTTTTRNVTFVVSDGKTTNALSNTLSTTIALAAVHTPPQLSGIETTPVTYDVLALPTPITATLNLTDSDSVRIVGATVKISTDYQNGQDVLTFANTATISGRFNAATGILTLTGTDTVANYQAALRSVMFQNTDVTPTIGRRMISFQVDDGSAANNLSNTVTRLVNVNGAGPALSPLQTASQTVIGPLTTPVTATLSGAEQNVANWTGATIRISGNFQSNQDVLGFADTATITGSWNSALGTLTLSGTASIANYVAALLNVTYHNSSATPNTVLPRTISFSVTDGTLVSDTVTRQLVVLADSGSPVVTGTSGPVTFVLASPPVLIVPNLVVTHPNGLELQSATISFSNWENGDRISFTNSFGLQQSFTSNLTTNTATLKISGVDTTEDYQTTLRSLVFSSAADRPVTWLQRIATITVNDILSNTGAATQNVEVNPVANAAPPIVSGTTAPVTYVELAAPVTIAPNLVVTDSLNIYSSTVSFANWQSGDRVQFSNSFALQHTFVENLAANTALLTITGFDTAAAYETTLRSVQFWSVAGSPVTWLQRTASFTVADLYSNTGTATQNVKVNPVANSAPPVVSGMSGLLTYVELSAPISIAPNLVLSDGLNLYRATVTFVNWEPGDRVSFTNSFALQHTFVEDLTTNTAALTLTGFDTAAHYQATLRSVVFSCVAGNPVTWLQRIATFSATDLYSNVGSASQSIRVSPIANGVPPTVSGTGSTSVYVESTAPVTVLPNLVVTDALNVFSATVSFSNWQPGDRIQFSNSFALQHSFVENLTTNTAVFTITGFATAANYQATLRSLQFWTVAASPVTWLRRVATITLSDLDSNSASATQDIAVNPIANSAPPILSGVAGTVTYVKNAAPLTVAPNLAVTDPLNIYFATVTFTNWQAGDRLQFVNSFALQHTFVENLDTNTATLTITGFATAAQYQTTLRTVQFWSVAGTLNTSTRVATFTLSDSNAMTAAGTQNISVKNA